MLATFNKERSRGFTIPELLVAMLVMGVLTGIVLGPLGDLYMSNTTTLARTGQESDTRGVLRSIGADLENSTGFETQLTVATPLGSNSGTSWSYCGTSCSTSVNRVLMAYTTATDKAPSDQTRLPIFVNTSGSCSPDIAAVAKSVYIYFVAPDTNNASINNLYRRTIVNPGGGTLCSTPWQKTTCSPTVSNIICQATDAVILKNISTFNADYYSSSNDSSPIANEYTSPAQSIASAKSVVLTVTTNVQINGVANTNSATVRISRPY